MKYFCFLFYIVILIYSCSTIPKKNKYDYYTPEINTKKVKYVNGQLSTLNCSKDTSKNYIIKFNKSTDSLTLKCNINFCSLLKKDLIGGSYIISNIDFTVNIKERKLVYKRYQYGVFDKNKKMLYKKSGGGLYCFYDDLEAFKKTIHFKISEAEFKIEHSTISIDSISSINLLTKFIN